MQRPRNFNPIPRLIAPDCRRSHGRVVCEMVTCSLGEVLDACGAGLRVRSAKPYEFAQGDIVSFTINGEDQPLEFKGRVIWTKKRGIRRYEMGLSFVELTPECRQALAQLAQGAAFNTTFFTSMTPRRRAI